MNKSKLALIGELLESDRMLREDAKQIFRLGEENKQLREALAMHQPALAAATGSDRKLLMCEVCFDTFYDEDDVTHECVFCGRAGFCHRCSSPNHHDCSPNDKLRDGQP